MHEATQRKLVETWLAANEGLASESDLAQLNRAIVFDSAFREHLLQLIQHQSWLQWNGTSENCVACESSPEMAGLLATLASVGGPEKAESRAGIRAVSRTAALVMSAFALGACVTGVAMWSIVGTDGQLANRERSPATVSGPQLRFVGATQCLWDSSSTQRMPVLGQELHGGESLHLLEGIAEVAVASNSLEARLHLEGPVAVMFSSQGMPTLRYGKMTLKVDGFSHETYLVETPFGRVEAEGGSEIGIASLGSTADVHAFAGSVSVSSPWLVTADQLEGSATIHSGEALRIENIGGAAVEVSRTASSRDLFLPEVSMDSDHLVVGPDYIREIRRAAPVAYWRFEGAEGGIVRNEMQDRFHGHLQRKVEWSGPRGNQAIQLGTSEDPGSMVVNDSWDEVLAGDFAIEAWIKPSHFHTGSIVGFVGEFNWKARKNTHGVLLEVCGIPHHIKSKGIRFLHRSPPTVGRGGVDCFSERSYAPRRWQYVVAQRVGDQLQLFINGELVHQLFDDSATPPGLQLVMGQLYSEAVERFFTGQVDEVAIYDRAISGKEVRKHYEILRPTVPTSPAI